MNPLSGVPNYPQVPGRLTVLAEGRVGSPRVSGDGSTVVWDVFDGDVNHVMRHRDGQVERLSTGLPSIHADLSHDGDVVIWDQLSTKSLRDPGANWDVVRYEDGEVRTVAGGPAQQSEGRISRDGRTVVWNQYGGGEHEGPGINVRLSRDGVEERVTEGPGLKMFPVVSGDGQRVVWRDLTGAESDDIWLRDEAGVIKPFVNTDVPEIQPELSPDGKTLLWVEMDGKERDLKIWKDGVISTVSGEERVFEMTATMTADGERVVWTDFDFRGGTPGRVRVLTKGEDGEVARVDRDDRGLSHHPVISDDGRTIVWMWQDSEDITNRRIYRLDLEP